MEIKINEGKLIAAIESCIEDIIPSNPCASVKMLLGKFKNAEIQLTVTRDEDDIMGADCNKRIVSVKEAA